MQTNRGLVFLAAACTFVTVGSHENALGIANIHQSIPQCRLSMMCTHFYAECSTGECSTLMAHKKSFYFVLVSDECISRIATAQLKCVAERERVPSALSAHFCVTSVSAHSPDGASPNHCAVAKSYVGTSYS